MSGSEPTKPIEESFIDWENHVFGLGYGTGERPVLAALRTFLEAIDVAPYDYEYLETAVGADVAWLLITSLVRADIIEYGTSPRYGWLTKEGQALRKFMLSKPLEEIVTLVCGAEEPSYCTPSICNCGPRGYQEGKKCGNPFWVCR